MKNLPLWLQGFIFVFLGVLVFLSLISYSPQDVVFLSYPHSPLVKNFVGIIGAYLSFALFFLFGYASYFIPFFFLGLGLDKLGAMRFYGIASALLVKIISFSLLLVFGSVILANSGSSASLSLLYHKAGLVGFFSAGFFVKYLGKLGSYILAWFIVGVCAALLFGSFFIDLFVAIKNMLIKLTEFAQALWQAEREFIRRRRERFSKQEPIKNRAKALKLKEKKQLLKKPLLESAPEIKIYTPAKPKPSSPAAKIPKPNNKGQELAKARNSSFESDSQQEQETGKPYDPEKYELPSFDILKPPPPVDYRHLKDGIQANAKKLEETLTNFGIAAKVVKVQTGPVVTRYELQPQAGVKIQQISSLADDISLAMKSASTRIVAPIPGKGTVGIEIPNSQKSFVSLREVVEEAVFQNSHSRLTMALGKDVVGNSVVADLKEMPHLLIAGATGSGKTVCVNSIICSILLKAKPEEVKFLLVDPKMVELAPYSKIPHLISPLISNAKKAFHALEWAVEEMEKRYEILASEGARNIDVYNKGGFRMPYIVIIVDELADLMAVARDSIETAIQRLAQLARAVGIHLILATQRPSVDVITGVIKANFSARISFKVSSKVDSRTVLDAMGAEKLLGKGDLLFLKPGLVKPIRIQGCFVEDNDINNLVNFVKAQGSPVYEDKIIQAQKKNTAHLEKDELLEDAIRVVLQARQASASLLQRRLRVGYTRAARLLDLMEQEGVVGPFQGSKARDILVDDPEAFLKERGLLV